MNLSLEEFEKLNELEYSIITIEDLCKILFEYDGNKEILVEILSEKTTILKENFDNFFNCLSK